MSRRKHTRLAHHLTRLQMQRVNAVLAANHCPLIAAGQHGKLPNVIVLLGCISGIELVRATRIMRELTWALDGAGKAERTS